MNSRIVLPPPVACGRRVVLLVPTCNPGPDWPRFLRALKIQTLQPQQVVVLDSQSSDGSQTVAQAQGCTVHAVVKAEFNHGATRQLGIDLYASDADVAVFMTQDAILADPQSLHTLLRAFDDPQVAAAYGRHLPHAHAKPISAHARRFNYPERGHTVTVRDIPRKGIKTCFLSNAFAAYRLSTLRQVGGFSNHLILGEDMQLAARLLLAGYAVRYQADALVYHSHEHSMAEEMGRYFDTGVMHSQQKWLQQTFGSADGEGLRFFTSEIAYLARRAPWLLPQSFLRTIVKYVAFILGKYHHLLPDWWVQRMSLNKGFWQ